MPGIHTEKGFQDWLNRLSRSHADDSLNEYLDQLNLQKNRDYMIEPVPERAGEKAEGDRKQAADVTGPVQQD